MGLVACERARRACDQPLSRRPAKLLSLDSAEAAGPLRAVHRGLRRPPTGLRKGGCELVDRKSAGGGDRCWGMGGGLKRERRSTVAFCTLRRPAVTQRVADAETFAERFARARHPRRVRGGETRRRARCQPAPGQRRRRRPVDRRHRVADRGPVARRGFPASRGDPQVAGKERLRFRRCARGRALHAAHRQFRRVRRVVALRAPSR